MLELFVIAVSLGLDAFSIAFAHGLCNEKKDPQAVFRLSLSFGSFQLIMTLLGFLFGKTIAPWLKQADIWIIAGIITLIGLHMIMDALRNETNENKIDLSKGWPLLMVSIATSLDAWAIGFSFALMEKAIVFPAVLIGLVAGIMSIMGVHLGKTSKHLNIKKPEIWGGLALIGIAIKMILERYFF